MKTIKESIPSEPQLQCSGRKGISHYCFNIKSGETFMIITQDEDESRNIIRALSSSNKENWTKVIKEEMESMISN